MARYQNEKWPHPEPHKDHGDERDAEKVTGSGPCPAPRGGGGGGGGGGKIVPRVRKSRPQGTPVIERSKFHHSGHGTSGKETDVERGKARTDNNGMGCIRRPDAEGVLTVAIMEPEPLMAEKDPFFQLSYGRFALQETLRKNEVKWSEDGTTGVTSVINISREQALSMCLEHGLKSVLFIEVGENRDWFHSVHFTSRHGKMVKKREHRMLGIEDGEAFERIEKHLLMRLPELDIRKQERKDGGESI